MQQVERAPVLYFVFARLQAAGPFFAAAQRPCLSAGSRHLGSSRALQVVRVGLGWMCSCPPCSRGLAQQDALGNLTALKANGHAPLRIRLRLSFRSRPMGSSMPWRGLSLGFTPMLHKNF